MAIVHCCDHCIQILTTCLSLNVVGRWCLCCVSVSMANWSDTGTWRRSMPMDGSSSIETRRVWWGPRQLCGHVEAPLYFAVHSRHSPCHLIRRSVTKHNNVSSHSSSVTDRNYFLTFQRRYISPFVPYSRYNIPTSTDKFLSKLLYNSVNSCFPLCLYCYHFMVNKYDHNRLYLRS